MKIRHNPPELVTLSLCDIIPGNVVRFAHVFHQKHKPTDLFIILDSCYGYRPECYQDTGHTAVANLRTGALSYVDSSRDCHLIDCEVLVQ